jgi:hypothetical protein
MNAPKLADAVVSLERELATRHALYPDRLRRRHQTAAKAAWEIQCLELARSWLLALCAARPSTEHLDDPTENGPTH